MEKNLAHLRVPEIPAAPCPSENLVTENASLVIERSYCPSKSAAGTQQELRSNVCSTPIYTLSYVTDFPHFNRQEQT